MASYASIFDNAFERRISQNVTLNLQTLEGTVYNSAALSSGGVSAMSGALDKEFRVRKTFKVGVTGIFQPDHAQTNLYGNGGDLAGPFGRTRNTDDAWPDPDLVHGLRTQSMEYGLFSDRSIFPFYFGDEVMNSDPMLVAKVLDDETQSFATHAAMRCAQSFYTSGNTKFAYASGITTGAASFASSTAEDYGAIVTNSILTLDLSAVNQYALNKLEVGMTVDLVTSANSGVAGEFNQLNILGTTGVKAIGHVVNISWVQGKVQIAFFAAGATAAMNTVGGVSTTAYAKNQLVDCRDFRSNIVATASGTWVVSDLTPSNSSSAITDGTYQKAAPLGLNDWFKTSGQLLAGTGYQNGSEGNGIINVEKVSMFQSYHENLANAPISDELMDGVIHRLIPQYNRFVQGARPDTVFTTYGVLQTYIQNKRAIADLTRTDGSLDLTREGATTGITFRTSSGVPLRMIADPFCDSGRVYILKVADNWAIDVPPEVPGASSSGPVSTPSGMPWRFVAQRAGWSSNLVPRQKIVDSSTRFTQDSYVPMECKMQLSCTKIPIGAIITGAKETTRYGATSNLTV